MMIEGKIMREAMFYEKLENKRVRCRLCAFNFMIPEGKTGVRRVRRNINGYMNPEPIREISPYKDAVTVDFKGSGKKEFLRKFSSVPSAEPIYRGLEEWMKQKVHIEITDLFVPNIGDSMEKTRNLVKWVKENLGVETPIHFLKFFPNYLVLDLQQIHWKLLKRLTTSLEKRE